MPRLLSLWLDIGFLDYLLDLEREQRKKTVGVTTRAQAEKQAAEEKVDQQQSEKDGTQPVAVEGVDSVVEDDGHEGGVDGDVTSDPGRPAEGEVEAEPDAECRQTSPEDEGLCLNSLTIFPTKLLSSGSNRPTTL